jgi:hypothetical protein
LGTGVGLARLALDVFRSRAGAYPDGIRVPELLHELEAAGHPVQGDDPAVKLRSALNASQSHGSWLRRDRGLWVAGDGRSKMGAGLAGRSLAEALHRLVGESDRYLGGVFHSRGGARCP